MDDLFASVPKEKQWIIQKFKSFLEIDWNRPGYVHPQVKPSYWGEYRFISGFTYETAKRAYELDEFYKDMVLLVSYPRTGTNWTMEIVRQILYGHDEKLNALSKAVPMLVLTILEHWEPEKFDLFEHMPLPKKIMYTHLPEELVNVETLKKHKTKVIVLLRNPKDQAVSWHHFVQGNAFNDVREDFSADWNENYANYIAGKHKTMMRLGEFYPDFLQGWYKHKGEENMMFLTFENLKRNHATEIRNIASFLGVSLSDERVSEIAFETSFNQMRGRQDSTSNQTEKIQSGFEMMRQGRIGGWKDYFTVAQSEQMDRIIEERLGHTDIKFIYE